MWSQAHTDKGSLQQEAGCPELTALFRQPPGAPERGGCSLAQRHHRTGSGGPWLHGVLGDWTRFHGQAGLGRAGQEVLMELPYCRASDGQNPSDGHPV